MKSPGHTNRWLSVLLLEGSGLLDSSCLRSPKLLETVNYQQTRRGGVATVKKSDAFYESFQLMSGVKSSEVNLQAE